jgi:hypothetical protein
MVQGRCSAPPKLRRRRAEGSGGNARASRAWKGATTENCIFPLRARIQLIRSGVFILAGYFGLTRSEKVRSLLNRAL